VIGKHSDEYRARKLRLQLSCKHLVSIINTFYQQGDLQKYTWCTYSLKQLSLIVLCVISADLFQSMGAFEVKKKCRTVVRSDCSCLNKIHLKENAYLQEHV